MIRINAMKFVDGHRASEVHKEIPDDSLVLLKEELAKLFNDDFFRATVVLNDIFSFEVDIYGTDYANSGLARIIRGEMKLK